MTGVSLISDIVRAKRLRWAEHVARREEEPLVKVVAFLQPAETRPAVRPRKR